MTQVRSTRRRWPVWFGMSMVAAVATIGLTAPPASAEGQVLGAGAPNAIKDSYLVELRNDAALRSRGVESVTGALAGEYGATVTHTYQHAVRGFAATLSESSAKKLAADPAVLRVEQNVAGKIDATQFNPPSYGLDRIDQRVRPLLGSYTYPNAAAGVTAYIIDSGIRTTHGDFGGRAFAGPNTIGGPNTDCFGHGTHVAGTVGGAAYGVAKGVLLIGVKVGDCAGNLNAATVLAGVDWVTAHHVSGPAVANMSLGVTPNVTLENAIRNSIADGVVYAISSGNGNTNACNVSPARVAEAITVNATDANDVRAPFSNYGTCTDIFAPGVNIVSAGHLSDTAGAVMSGTSMAAPHVAGAAALLLAENPALNPQQVAGTLYYYATTGLVADAVGGSPNRLLFVQHPTPPAAAAGPDRLIRGQALFANQFLRSPNGAYHLYMQADGNLVLYRFLGTPYAQVLWQSFTSGNPGSYAYLQPDGNFVIYRANNTPRWHLATYNTAANLLAMQDDGNLVLYGPAYQVYWYQALPGYPI